ncbi:uncharacterized protein LOC126810545 isoform X2 [Patella vulgata]|nr:uncharacterized protein LOC126810545 isoform X2 [Patella vulgata]
MKKWILHLESGAWCSSVRACESRSKTRLGSSKFEAKTRRLEGLMSSNPKINPDFYQWNIVEFLYCDGSSFLGNLSKPINYHGKELYLSGAVIFEIIVEHLLKNTNIGMADLVLLTGSSAGGLASLIHADHLRQTLPKTVTTVKNVVDGSLFLDQKSTTDEHLMKNMLKETFELHNIKDSLILRKCTDQRAETDKWQCFMPEVFMKYTQTPTFYFNSYFDTWYGRSPLKLGCWFSNLPCSSKENDVTKDLQTALMQVTHKILEKDSNGIFLTSCICHTIMNNYRFARVVSQGITGSTALKWWLNNEPRGKKIIDVLENQNSWKNCF